MNQCERALFTKNNMPLVIISGIPLSGKTTRALELKNFLESKIAEEVAAAKLKNTEEEHGNVVKEKGKAAAAGAAALTIQSVVLINEEALELDKHTTYKNADSEKKLRAKILSAVERHLSQKDIVICDFLNYIKGYRYQLYVIARAMGTPTCTLYCGAGQEESLKRNLSVNHYDDSILENLCSRFEEPDGRNRWDAPLFTIIDNDNPLDDSPTNPLSLSILEALVKKGPTPNRATVTKPIFDSDYLTQVDKVLEDIVETVIEAQKKGRNGDIVVPMATRKIELPSRFISLAEFRRIKRQYLHLNKSHTIADLKAVGNAFVEYFNTQLSE